MTDRLQPQVDNSMQHVWEALGDLSASPVVREARAYAAADMARRTSRQRTFAHVRRFAPAGFAALAASVAVALFVNQASPPAPIIFTTRTGEIRTEQLADGSRVVLDTGSRLEVSLSGDERKLTLVNGKAHFDVAHDPERPFTVTFRRGSVTALGTEFDVASTASANAVTLLSGRVVVAALSPSSSGPQRIELRPGQQVSVTEQGKFTARKQIDLRTAKAWQTGQIDLTDLRLVDAIAQVNRYSETQIVVNSPTLSDQRISGIFKAGDTASVVEALCAFFDLEVTQSTAREIVLTPKGATARR